MSQTASYFLAAVPEPVRVLGLELRDFSIGHCITLHRFCSAFVSETEVQSDLGNREERNYLRDEVIFAALVCRFTYEEFYEFIRQPDAQEQLAELGKDVGLFSIKEKSKLLQDYISEASKMPPFVFEQEESKSGAHWLHTVKAGLVAHCGYTEDRALNDPMQKCIMDFFKHAESNGVITLISDEELEKINALN